MIQAKRASSKIQMLQTQIEKRGYLLKLEILQNQRLKQIKIPFFSAYWIDLDDTKPDTTKKNQIAQKSGTDGRIERTGSGIHQMQTGLTVEALRSNFHRAAGHRNHQKKTPGKAPEQVESIGEGPKGGENEPAVKERSEKVITVISTRATREN